VAVVKVGVLHRAAAKEKAGDRYFIENQQKRCLPPPSPVAPIHRKNGSASRIGTSPIAGISDGTPKFQPEVAVGTHQRRAAPCSGSWWRRMGRSHQQGSRANASELG
jgi:hypothetical protein